MEATYINTGHPDFINGHRAMAVVNDRLNSSKPQPAAPTVDAKGRPIPPPANGPAGSPSQQQQLTSSMGNLNIDPNETLGGGNTGFFGSFFAQKKKKGSPMEPPPPVLKASGTLSEREMIETEVIKLLIQSYFNIVKRTVVDMVPKAVMLNLVQRAKEDLQRELLAELYKAEVLDDLLKESEFTMQRRKECKKMIEALTKADEVRFAS